jgi:hypothetical protein
MRPLRLAVLTAGSLWALPTMTFAQVSNDAPLTQCDTYSANPLDPQRKGPGVPREKLNPALAIPACMFALAKFPSSPRLKYQLGRSYHIGKNFREALAYYQQAAQYGYVIAEASLGEMSLNGEGIPRNYRDAFLWYSKAASKGFAPAQFNIGTLYENGQGVNKNIPQAVEWYRRAAQQGLPGAQENLRRVTPLIGSHYFLRSVHNSWQPDREGQFRDQTRSRP